MTLNSLLEELWGFRFDSPWLLALLLLLPLWAWLRGRYAPVAAVQYSSTELLKAAARRPRFTRNRMQILMRLSAVNLLILALARPQWELALTEQEAMGINVAFNLDFSESMATKDFTMESKRVSRADGVKSLVSDFIHSRPLDRLALVRFDAAAHLISPLTLDHDWLQEQLALQHPGEGSAPGSGMVIAAEALQPARGQTTVMITITDANGKNEGPPPEQAARAIEPLQIRNYVVQIADFGARRQNSNGGETFRTVAYLTGGEYFQVSDAEALREVLRQIDDRERAAFREKQRKVYRELMGWFVWPAGLILLVELMMTHLVWRRLP